jgi:hypothetical protein
MAIILFFKTVRSKLSDIQKYRGKRYSLQGLKTRFVIAALVASPAQIVIGEFQCPNPLLSAITAAIAGKCWA